MDKQKDPYIVVDDQDGVWVALYNPPERWKHQKSLYMGWSEKAAYAACARHKNKEYDDV